MREREENSIRKNVTMTACACNALGVAGLKCRNGGIITNKMKFTTQNITWFAAEATTFLP